MENVNFPLTIEDWFILLRFPWYLLKEIQCTSVCLSIAQKRKFRDVRYMIFSAAFRVRDIKLENRFPWLMRNDSITSLKGFFCKLLKILFTFIYIVN